MMLKAISGFQVTNFIAFIVHINKLKWQLKIILRTTNIDYDSKINYYLHEQKESVSLVSISEEGGAGVIWIPINSLVKDSQIHF